MADFVYSLDCEDASHLGGPMGTEYTVHVWSMIFADLDSAKEHAERYIKEPIDWKKDSISWYADVGAYVFTIKKARVLERSKK